MENNRGQSKGNEWEMKGGVNSHNSINSSENNLLKTLVVGTVGILQSYDVGLIILEKTQYNAMQFSFFGERKKKKENMGENTTSDGKHIKKNQIRKR